MIIPSVADRAEKSHLGPALFPPVPSGEELFATPSQVVVESAAARHLLKPRGTSDQGYAED